jgi:dTDP-4-dehydrorhamnose reductase
MPRSVLVLGGSGLVGACVRQRWAETPGDSAQLSAEPLHVEAPSHAELNVLDERVLARYVEMSPAQSVINFAAWADVDGAEAEVDDTTGRVYALNVDFPRRLAALCKQSGKHVVHISTDYVFDGTRADRPYAEGDATRALSWYAETKLRGEQAMLASGASACIARIEMPFTGRQHTRRDLARTIAARLGAGQPVQGVADQHITPVFVDDAADALRRLLETRWTGIVHVASTTSTTPYLLACAIGRSLGLPLDLIQEDAFERFSKTRTALRPQHSWLDVTLFSREFGAGVLRPVESALDAWAEQLRMARTSTE